MELRDKLAQLVFPRIGSNLPPVRTASEDEPRVAQLLQEACFGGLCLFHGQWPDTAATLARLQGLVPCPLLVAADVERGAGQQIHGLTLFPHAMAIDALGDDAETVAQLVGQATGREALACGVHIVLGPVADVNVDPQNPIIATRAFSDQAARVGRLAAAYVRGCQSEGAYCAAKHFPGHGNTRDDSHDVLPVIHDSVATIIARDLAPFRSAIEAGSRLVMTAHVAYPAFDRRCLPATLSRPILQELLRAQLQFDGVIVSDSLMMDGVRKAYANETEVALAALQAGVDLLLDPGDPLALLEGLLQCVRSGRLSTERIDRSCSRIARLKGDLHARLGGPDLFRHPSPAAALALAGGGDGRDPEFERLARRLAEQAVVYQGAGEPSVSLPLRRPGLLLARPFRSRWDPAEPPLAAALRASWGDLFYCEAGPEPFDSAAVIRDLLACDPVVVALVVKPAAWHQFCLQPEQVALVSQLLGQHGGTVVLCSLGVPAVLEQFPQAQHRICTYSDVPASQLALARRLLRRAGTP